MKLVYVAGKYSAPTREEVQANIDKADEVAKQLMLRGYVPVIPHKITAFWDLDERFSSMNHADWIEKYCIPLQDACSAIAMVPGWRDSFGATQEHEHALEVGQEVIYIDEMPPKRENFTEIVTKTAEFEDVSELLKSKPHHHEQHALQELFMCEVAKHCPEGMKAQVVGRVYMEKSEYTERYTMRAEVSFYNPEVL